MRAERIPLRPDGRARLSLVREGIHHVVVTRHDVSHARHIGYLVGFFAGATFGTLFGLISALVITDNTPNLRRWEEKAKATIDDRLTARFTREDPDEV